MKPVSLPYLNSYPDRHGKVRWYYRRGRYRKILPGEPGSPEFMLAYQRCLGSPTPAPESAKPVRGTIEALVQEFYKSGEYEQLKPSTRREYRYRLEWLRTTHGHKPVHLLERRHVLRMRDEKATKPGEANTLLRIIMLILSFAVERGYRKDNPALGIKFFKKGEFRDWTDAELVAFRERWSAGSVERLAFSLLLYTGQRRADVAAMTAHDFNGTHIAVVQAKTGTRLSIPAHPELIAELERRKTKGKEIMLLQTKTGKAFTSEALGQFLADAIAEAKLPDECVVHGLRKTAAKLLAEAGCSEDEIMAITGHRTASMVRLYVKGAKRSKMADAAVLKWKASEKA